MFEEYISNELNHYYSLIENSKLKEIISYSLEGGKCIRGFIVKNIIETLTNSPCTQWQPIVAIELVHGISLILDDLPCMDNDVMRRNKPSTFAKFGERHAILISMFGISEAFRLLFSGIKEMNLNNIEYIDSIECIIQEWNELIGNNLVVGQMLDFRDNVCEILNVKLPDNAPIINCIYYKTSSLFIFAFILGGLFSGIQINMNEYKLMGQYFGLMYQIMDDSMDVVTDTVYNNIVLSLGRDESLMRYRDSEYKLLELLVKNNILTPAFEKLISGLNKKLML